MKKLAFNGLHRPLGKYREIYEYCLRPDPEPKAVDLCCGLGFGKTVLGIQIAAQVLNLSPNQRVLFLEPDWDRVNDIFLPKWEKYVPEELYRHNIGKHRIEWWNGAYLNYRPRVITGSRSRRRGKFKGIEFTVVIDDETAEEFDLQQYINTFARIRSDTAVDVRFYLTLTTPIIGPYSRFLKRGGNKIFKGRTRDNFYLRLHDPTYETRQRRNMSEDQARRELDAELIALEGRIWKTVDLDKPWPHGNLDTIHKSFDPLKPWWLFCDFGSATGSYVVVQQRQAHYLGRELFREPVWVAVADLCPVDDADASRAFQELKTHFGTPVLITGGKDMNTAANTDGKTIAYFAEQTWGNVEIFPVSERVYHKRIQYNRMNFLICAAYNAQGQRFRERRFTIAQDFASLEPRSNRGVREMFLEDQWPDIEERRQGDFLPKNKDIIVQHTRDALLMGATIMSPPDWALSNRTIE